MHLVECYSDENLLRALGIPGRDIRRMRGKGNVMRFLQRKVDGPCIALLDLDRNEAQPSDLKVFTRQSEEHGVSMYTWKEHRLIFLDDNLEDWLVRAVKRAGKRMNDFGLPDDVRALHAIEPKVGDSRFAKAISFLDEVHSPALLALRRFLERVK
ncbi:MAG TPA: hypothetical protein PLV08_14565 [Flavobacteriales bacterium]|jgi:hypothetical protein|nr:hypothetical protein [Flavobacteriales bacterium]MBK7100656.1 hypothetical protein [Flavobacteriales bacterium]MBK7111353.1 hypothetical protein [Flavobacteriales bacterium]MBK7484291.1 hypothetical protein [Flavobacteriales bacterium]MBK7618214.1 hypothetical protein [Flavobacteriales bacterium]